MRNKTLAWLEGSPSFDGRVILLAGPPFLHINTLAHQAGSTRSRRDVKSTGENGKPAVDSDKGLNFFSYKGSLN